VLAEYCLPLVKKDGFFVALKGSKYKEEIAEAKDAVRILGGSVTSVKEVELPGLDDRRAVIVIRKMKDTPSAYPRKAGLPGKSPLGSAYKEH
jgi:16S rRNA (guanine527-N7)-methyltransferase